MKKKRRNSHESLNIVFFLVFVQDGATEFGVSALQLSTFLRLNCMNSFYLNIAISFCRNWTKLNCLAAAQALCAMRMRFDSYVLSACKSLTIDTRVCFHSV